MGNETIGYRIRRARMFRGVTQAELARQIGLSANAMNQIERGHTRAPGADVIQRISRFLQVSADFLLCLSDEMQQEAATPAMAGT